MGTVVNLMGVRAKPWIDAARKLQPMIFDRDITRMLATKTTEGAIKAELFRMVVLDHAWMVETLRHDNYEFGCLSMVEHPKAGAAELVIGERSTERLPADQAPFLWSPKRSPLPLQPIGNAMIERLEALLGTAVYHSTNAASVCLRCSMRHLEASRSAHVDDSTWFASHRGRRFRIRDAVAFECDWWGKIGHIRYPFMIVHQVDGSLHKRPASGDRPHDNDAFLRSVWNSVDRAQTNGTKPGETRRFDRAELSFLEERTLHNG